METYLNIHSHIPSSDPATRTLVSLYADFEWIQHIQYGSIGLHPWYLDDWEQKTSLIEQLIPLPQIMAVGECGLDKACNTPWDIQIKAFQYQLDLAEKIQKPLIIHCVRAFAEILEMIKSVTVPVIFHGFEKHPDLVKELVSHGAYLSFGKALVERKINAIESLKAIPADRFFLETDDSEISIQDIYRAAFLIRNLSEQELTAQLHHNYNTVFKK